MSFSMEDIVRISKLSESMGISFDVSEDVTRQEFKEECDVNHILTRHGFVPRPVEYGVVDFDSDLTAKMQSRSLFEAWYAEAPAEVREMYADMGAFLRAFGQGAFEKGPEGAEVSSAPSEPSASPPQAGALG